MRPEPPLTTVALVVLAVIAAALAAGLVAQRRRFAPIEDLIEEMEKVDLSRPGPVLPASIDGVAETEEAERLELAFLRMMNRLEAERRRAGSAALRAQEEERARVARDLHDEVNQSLTGLLLRLEAVREEAPPELATEVDETKALANRRCASCSLSPASCGRRRSTTSASPPRSAARSSRSPGPASRRPSRPTATSPTSMTTCSWSSTASPRRRSPTPPATARRTGSR